MPLKGSFPWRLLFFGSLLTVLWLATRDPGKMPELFFSIDDLFQHAATFLYLAVIMRRAYPMTRHSKIWMFLTAYGIFIEAVQSLIPFREASVADLMANTAGLGLFEIGCRIKALIAGRPLR